MEENNLDKYFQEKLAGHTEVPPPAVWEGIAVQTSKGGFFWNRRYLLSLLLLISIGGAAFFGIQLYEVDSRVAELEETIKIKNKEIASNGEKNKGEAADKSSEGKSRLGVNSTIAAVEKNDFENLDKVEESSQKKGLTDAAGSTNSDQKDPRSESSGSMTTSESKAGNSVYTGLALKPTTEAKSSSNMAKNNGIASTATAFEEAQKETNSLDVLIGDPENDIPNSRLPFNPVAISSIVPSSAISSVFKGTYRDADYYRQTGTNWFIFLYGMANYTHRRVVAQAEGAESIPNQLDKVENGLLTPGGGLQLSRELGKKFRLSIGIEYNQWIQEGAYDIEVLVEEVSVGTNTITELAEFSYGGEIASSLGSNSYNSSSTENPFGEEFATLTPNTDPLAFQLETRRRIDYLTVPIILEYVYNAYPFRLTLGGGISVNHIIGTEFSSEVVPSAPGFEIKDTEAVNGTYLAFQAGFGIEYGISERMSLRLNPSYRGWMTPIFENEEFRTLPFGVAVRAGLIYRLGK